MSTYEQRLKKMGLNIVYYRKLAGMNQEDLAKQAGISRTHLGNIEAPNMFVAPSLETLFKIADALKIEPHKLLMFKK